MKPTRNGCSIDITNMFFKLMLGVYIPIIVLIYCILLLITN